MATTKIEWTDKTWNPITGCTKISPGCENCYAELLAARIKSTGLSKYANGFTMTTHENTLTEPLSWGKGSYIFVCSMSDLFHEKAPFKFIDRIMETINQSKRHTYQILTKRAARMAEYFAINPVPSNAWIGVTVECRKTIARIDSLREIDASKRFISFEPLIEDVGQLDLHGIDWVIVGGETGNKARPTQPDWVRSIRVQSEQLNIPFFFKQWGTWGPDGIRRSKKANGGELDGEIVRMFPSHLHKARVQ